MAQDVAATRPALQLMQAWNRADATAWGDLFWPDARFTNVIGGTYVGASDIAAQHARIWASIYQGSHGVLGIVATRPLGPDHLLIEAYATLTGARAAPPGVHLDPGGVIHTRLAIVTERRASDWRIVFAQNTVINPRPSGPPK